VTDALTRKIVEAVVESAWEKIKAGVGEGGKELLKNPWPMIHTMRFIAGQLEAYAQEMNIKETKK
jgi:hypothetical protein